MCSKHSNSLVSAFIGSKYGLPFVQIKGLMSERLFNTFNFLHGRSEIPFVRCKREGESGTIWALVDKWNPWDLTTSAWSIYRRMFSAPNVLCKLTIFFTQDVAWTSTSMERPGKFLEAGLAIFSCLLMLALTKLFFGLLSSSALTEIELLFSAAFLSLSTSMQHWDLMR